MPSRPVRSSALSPSSSPRRPWRLGRDGRRRGERVAQRLRVLADGQAAPVGPADGDSAAVAFERAASGQSLGDVRSRDRLAVHDEERRLVGVDPDPISVDERGHGGVERDLRSAEDRLLPRLDLETAVRRCRGDELTGCLEVVVDAVAGIDVRVAPRTPLEDACTRSAEEPDTREPVVRVVALFLAPPDAGRSVTTVEVRVVTPRTVSAPIAVATTHSSRRVDAIDGIIRDVPVQIRIATPEADRVRRRPAPGRRVVVAGPEMDEPGVRVEQAAGEPEWDEPGRRIAGDPAPRVVVDRLGDGTGRRVDDEARTTHRVGDDAIGLGALLHRGEMPLVVVREPGRDGAGTIRLRRPLDRPGRRGSQSPRRRRPRVRPAAHRRRRRSAIGPASRKPAERRRPSSS